MFSGVELNWRIWNFRVGNRYRLITAKVQLPDDDGKNYWTDIEFPNALITEIKGRILYVDYYIPGMEKYLGFSTMNTIIEMDRITGVFR